MTEKELAINMAKKINCETASFLQKWKDMNIYTPDFLDDALHYVGILPYILIKDGNARFSTEEETFTIMNL